MSSPVDAYLKRKELLREIELRSKREPCLQCRRPLAHCYCSMIKVIDPNIEFAILIHPIENRRQIATGRMAHFSLKNSHLIKGEDYLTCPRVNALIESPDTHAVMLYPGAHSKDLSRMSEPERETLFPKDKRLVVFVIDGTWHTASSTVYRSHNLARLPRICFSPTTPSRFVVRKQPEQNYHSTIEAIHQTIELLGQGRGFDVSSRAHDGLLRPLDWMVARQLENNPYPRFRPRRG